MAAPRRNSCPIRKSVARYKTLRDPGASHRREAQAEPHALLNSEQGGILQIANHHFADTLSQIRDERAMARIRHVGLHDGQNITVNLQAMATIGHTSNEDQTVHDIHDILKADYKVALKPFTDNVSSRWWRNISWARQAR